MKKFLALIFLSILFTSSSCSFLLDKNKSEKKHAVKKSRIVAVKKPENSGFKKDDGFMVAMTIGDFENSIKQQKEGKKAPRFKSQDKIVKGEDVDIVFDISGCSPNDSGFCEIYADLICLASNQKVYFEAKDMPLSVSSIKPEKDVFFLSDSSLKFRPDEEDPLGKYSIIAKVKDKVSGKNVNLIIRFDVFDKEI